MLNATLCATERTMCCILENYQEAEGVRIPEVLQPFMGGLDFIPYNKKKVEQFLEAKAKENEKKTKTKK
jgi:seryl-tRNA synthetase